LRLFDIDPGIVTRAIFNLGGSDPHVVEVQLRLGLQHAAKLLQYFVFGMGEPRYLE
jgi:hypothetical protein